MDIKQLKQKASAGAWILTPNKRLSRHVFKQCLLGEKIQPSPNVLPWQAFLKHSYLQACQQGLLRPKTLLTPAQENYRWQVMIQQHYRGLTNIHALAKLAQSAWHLLQDWQLDLQDALFRQTQDTEIFQQVASAYADYLQQANLIDSALLSEEILKLAREQPDFFPPLIAYDFQDSTPQQQAFFEILNVSACAAPLPGNRHRYQIAHADEFSEIKHAAQFAKMWHDKHPEKSLSIIMPQLNQYHSLALFYFREVFGEALCAHHQLRFDFSYGKPLFDYPLIQLSMALLSCAYRFDQAIAEQLLLSPLLPGFEGENAARAHLAITLREKIGPLSVVAFQRYCQTHCPRMANLISNFLETHAPSPLETHAEVFLKRLKSAGIGQDPPLSSTNFQALKAFEHTIETLAQLDLSRSVLSEKTALTHLRQLQHDSLFQPESNPQANIHIFGTFEALGLEFDAIYFCQLNENQWPPTATPHPLLPKERQRLLNMPGANPKKQTAFYRQVLETFIHRAETFIASYTQQQADIPIAPTAMIRDFPPYPDNWQPLQAATDFSLEAFEDWQAPIVTADTYYRGGSQILKRQALCPFKAFAESRLMATDLPTHSFGLDPKTRGQLLHLIMEKCWRVWGDLNTLKETPENLIHSILRKQISEALALYPTLPHYYHELEINRFERLITRWLSLEKKRAHFQVAGLEVSQPITLGKITFNVRLDRIDQLENGDYVLIDYKSMAPSRKAWFGERPDEPQLPLYTFTLTAPLAALCFAQMNTKACRFVGYAMTTANIPGLDTPPAPWSDLQAQWKTCLHALSHDFYLGKAEPNPRDGSATCDQCHLQSLCRIHSLTGP